MSTIMLYNNGNMKRDFTYLHGIVEGLVRVIDQAPVPIPEWLGDDPDPGTSYAPYRIYSIDNNNPLELLSFIEVMEECLGRKAIKNLMPIQAGDVPATYVDVDDLTKDVGLRPRTSIEYGIRQFIEWYKFYYGV